MLLTGSICDRDVVVEICILMPRSDKILQIKTLHYMYWGSAVLDVEFYRLYIGLWARNLMPWFLRYSQKFAVFIAVSIAPNDNIYWQSFVLPQNDC